MPSALVGKFAFLRLRLVFVPWEVSLRLSCIASADAKSTAKFGGCGLRKATLGLLAPALGAVFLLAGHAWAQDATPAADASSGTKISVELNKLEPQEASCRAYLVLDNQVDKSYDVLKLDLVLFQTDGIIGRRFALDLAPIKAKKRSVKLFDLDGVKCETIGSFLINDVMDCKSGGSDVEGCLERLDPSSRSKVQLSK